jgi:anhydro-N-acetylmuramic acid kinase
LAGERRLIVNLGGFCNVTFIRSAAAASSEQSLGLVEGCDLFPCNHVLDAIAARCFGTPFDEGGRNALRGTPHATATAELRTMLLRCAQAGRSLGTGDELLSWVNEYEPRLTGPDLAASACEAMAGVIAAAAARKPDTRIIVAGGSVRNAALLAALRRNHPGQLCPSDDVGVPASHREAICFAVLGALCQDRVPITLPRVTGVPAPAPISGCWAMP